MNRKQDVIEKLNSSANDTYRFFRSLTDDELNVQVYSDGAKWTVRQVLAHLISIEKTMHWLFRNILDGGPGSPGDFDVERFNRKQPLKYENLSMDELIQQFKAVRVETIGIVEKMNESDLDRVGNHAFHGKGRLERFIRWAYEHVQIHEDDIRDRLKTIR